MIDDGLLNLEQSIAIFKQEHGRRITERLMEDGGERRELAL